MRIKLILLSMLLTSCSYLSSPVLSPYKMDIRQGNYVSPEMRDKLKIGMSKQQVRYVLGTPMVSDAFHGNRWDYVYRLEQRGEMVEKQHLTLYFDNDKLVRADEGGRPVAAMAEMVQQPVAAPPVATIPQSPPAAKADPEADVLERVNDWAAAWSSKDANGYLAAYTPDYRPDGMSHEAWKKQRLERIGKPRIIEVSLSGVSVSMQDDTHVTVSFTQHYRSDLYRDSMRKVLRLEKTGDSWLIISEQAAK